MYITAIVNGSPLCEICPTGTFSNGLICTQCEQGKVSGVGSNTCTSCPEGSVNFHLGSSRCYFCTPGKFASSDKKSCIQCPSSSFSDGGANMCINC